MSSSEGLVTVSIDGLTYGGAFIGRVTDGPRAGMKIFIRGVAPGELVTARITSDRRNFLEGELENIHKISASRVTPECPYYDRCGGCDLQHLSLGTQREEKRKMVESTLYFQGRLKPIEGVFLVGESLPGYGYRSRVTLHLNRSGDIGFYREGSGEVIDIEHCPIANETVNRILREHRRAFSALAPWVGGIVIESRSETPFVAFKLLDEVRVADFERALGEKIPTKSFIYSVKHRGKTVATSASDAQSTGHFSQVNPLGNEILTHLILQQITGVRVTEFFAGAGNFSIPLAQSGRMVTAIEVDPVLTDVGMKRVAKLKLTDRVSIVTMSAERYAQKNPFTEVVVLDPPRAGAKAVADRCDPKITKEIIYVSCNLPTFCRDAQMLTKRFKLERVYVVDMFAQTHHVEIVARFSQ